MSWYKDNTAPQENKSKIWKGIEFWCGHILSFVIMGFVTYKIWDAYILYYLTRISLLCQFDTFSYLSRKKKLSPVSFLNGIGHCTFHVNYWRGPPKRKEWKEGNSTGAIDTKGWFCLLFLTHSLKNSTKYKIKT